MEDPSPSEPSAATGNTAPDFSCGVTAPELPGRARGAVWGGGRSGVRSRVRLEVHGRRRGPHEARSCGRALRDLRNQSGSHVCTYFETIFTDVGVRNADG